jgi:hypothetical protein
MEQRNVGEAVIFVDDVKREHFALLTAVHGAGDKPCVNLMYVSSDENKTDTYGRQVERFSSCVHISNNSAQANCWKDLHE